MLIWRTKLKTDNTKCDDLEELELSYVTGGGTKQYTPLENCLAVSYKVKHTPSTHCPEIPLLSIYKRNEAYVHKQCGKMFIAIHSSPKLLKPKYP